MKINQDSSNLVIFTDSTAWATHAWFCKRAIAQDTAFLLAETVSAEYILEGEQYITRWLGLK